jgi:gas vesicle protein
MTLVKDCNEYLKSAMQKIETILNHPENLTNEGMDEMLHDMFGLFLELKNKMNSANEQERKEIMQFLSELKTKMEEQVAKLCDSLGIDAQALQSYFNNAANFGTEEWKAIEKAKNEFDELKESVLN